VAGPGIATGRSNALISLADIAPTIIESAEAHEFRGIQGRSFLQLATSGQGEHRDAVLIEEDMPFGTAGLDGPVRMRTIVTDAGRLTIYHGHDLGECYDYASDPGESRNIYGRGTPLEERLRQRLFDEVLTLADEGKRMEFGA